MAQMPSIDQYTYATGDESQPFRDWTGYENAMAAYQQEMAQGAPPAAYEPAPSYSAPAPTYEEPPPSAPSVSLNADLSDLAGANYSPEVITYINDMYAQRQALLDKYGPGISLNNPEFLSSRYVQEPASDSYSKVYTSEEDMRYLMGQDASSVYNPGYDVQSWGGSRSPTVFDMVRLGADQTYTYTDNNTGQTYTASTPKQVQALTQLAKSQSGYGNNSASWSIKDSSGKEVASDTSYKPSLLKQGGQMIADSLPAIFATMALGPGAGWALSGLTAGGATAAYQGAKGASLEDSLLAGLKAGVLTGATTFASPYINSALTNAGLDFPGMSSFFPAGSPGAFDVGGAYGGSLGNVGGVETFLSGATRGAPALTGSLAGGLTSGALSSPAQGLTNAEYETGPSTYQPDGTETVTKTGYRAPVTPVTSAVLPAIASSLSSSEYETGPSTYQPDGTETVTKTGYRAPVTPVTTAVLPAIVASGLDGLSGYDTGEQLGYDDKPADPAKEDPSKLDTIDKVKLALTGASLLGGLAGGGGGGGSGAGGTVPAGFENAGKMPESFKTDKLPTGDAIPAFGGGTSPASRTARDMSGTDWNRYGFNPEKSFFSNVPQRAAKGGSMAVTRPAKSFAVRGAGDGRSDDIPAVLSDGEYVMDAETVALLGNGSNKAGAAQLDRFRANVRKHKGKELAKGRFSVNAKNPQAYLAGGRT